jgi:acetolactate synthase-1/2/3 large subunit
MVKEPAMESELNSRDLVKNGLGIALMLADRGVKHVFGIPDGHTLDFYDGMRQCGKIEHVLVNDERTAAFAADAYARVSGTLGVCDAGAPGALNFPVALAEAKGSSSPVLAIIGMLRREYVMLNIPHDVNITDTVRPVTKWAGMAFSSDHVPRFLEYAIRQSINGRPGPTAVVIPEDLFGASDNQLGDFVTSGEGGACSINGCRAAPAEHEIDRAVDMIRKAHQPAILVGGGAVAAAAYLEVAALARMLAAPVFSTITGKGIVVPTDGEDNIYFGTSGLFGESPNNKFLRKQADLVIVVGSRLTEDDTANFKYPPDRKDMIQIDIDPGEIGKRYHPWGVAGDAKIALEKIVAELNQGEVTDTSIVEERQANLQDLRAEHQKYREKDTARWADAEPIKPERVLKAISDTLGEGDYLVTDASASSRWIGPYFPVKGLGRHIITPRGVGPTGFGIGALIGTCIAADTWEFSRTKTKKVLFTGDGGLMNGGLSDFETIVKLGLDCTVVIINNAALGFVKFGQLAKGIYETERPATDFARIAESFGGTGFRVEQLGGLDSAITDAINHEGFNLVDVVVDPQELLPPSSF